MPEWSLQRTFRNVPRPEVWDHYRDCFVTTVPRTVSLADYVDAFYNSWLFKLERWILAVLLRLPSRDDEPRRLVQGSCERFSAWVLTARTDEQLLMSDFQSATRSWFAVAPTSGGSCVVTQLYFGSGIAAVLDGTQGAPRMTLGFRLLGGFHVLYSRLLLAAARARLLRATNATRTPYLG